MPPKTALERATSYSVAWIAALAHERAAALVLLDERHDKPKDFTKSESDQNSYSWGRIGDHNVVIASLPAGEYGTVSAADTTSGLRASLPHIRIGLLVGIGAGLTGEHVGQNGRIAIKNEILLGDVVVSVPDGTNSGVVQHDFYKAKVAAGKQDYERKGFLNAAPRALRNAVSALQADHEAGESQIEEYLQVFKQNKKMKAQYSFPGSEKDRIRQILQIDTDDDVRTQPDIHYGTIVSGNTLVKSAAVRDEILAKLKEENVHPLCLEMEAAGLMNSFPCIVIRGVCDYGDEYKNDDWQRYAAAIAAAFAKELLTYVVSAEVHKEQALDHLNRDVQQVKSDTTKVRDILSASERREILSWLCPMDYAQLYDAYSRARIQHTGDWLLGRSEFKDWHSAENSPVLYCSGSPGVGKTFLATRIIEFLFTLEPPPKAAVTYMYCDYSRRGEQNVAHFLSCLLRQLTHAADTVSQSVQDLHTKYSKRNTRPMDSELLEALRTVVSHEFEIVYVVVDALDECDSKTRSTLIKHLRAMAHAQDVNLRFLATSRLIPEIDDVFFHDQQLRLDAASQDIREYVRVRTAEIQERLSFSQDIFSQITDTIVPAVRGMFLLARFHMDTLESKTNARDIADALLSLPDGYNAAYEAAMTRINNQDEGHRNLAKQVLMWVACANRPLLATQLQHAIAIRSGDKALRNDGLTRIGLLVAVCAGLVALRDNSVKAGKRVEPGATVHLAHYTAQEYFDRAREDWFPGAELSMSRSCLSYLALDEFEKGPCDNTEQLKSRLRQYPFLGYAAPFWGLHAAMMSTHGDTHEWNVLQEAVGPFLRSSRLCDATIQVQTLIDFLLYLREGELASTPRQSTACHLFARFGLGQLCDHCHDFGIDVLALDSDGQPPFYYALTACPNTNADALLSWSRQTELSKYGNLALWYAVKNGELQSIAKLLRLASIDSNARMFSDTPLTWAATSGHPRTVQALIGCPKVNINAVTKQKTSALLAAAIEWRDDIVSVLLTVEGIDVNYQGAEGATALWHACRSSRPSTVRILCEHHSVDVNLPNFEGESPLMRAVISGNTDLMTYLMERDEIDFNLKDAQGRTALWYACDRRHWSVARSLAEKTPINFYAYDLKALSPITLVDNSEGCTLLDSGLINDVERVHRRNKLGNQVLHVAALNGHFAITKWLLQLEKLDVDGRNSHGETPLILAANAGGLSIVKMLLQTMAVDLNAENYSGHRPLSLAAAKGHLEVVECLLDDLFSVGEFRLTRISRNLALSFAAQYGQEDVVAYLLERNDINVFAYSKSEVWSPLTLAASEGHFTVYRMLAEEMRRCDSDRFDDCVKWACQRLVPGAGVMVHAMIGLLWTIGYDDLASYCRRLPPKQMSIVLRLWGPYASCSVCGVSNLATCWCCLDHEQLICHECLGSGFWCDDREAEHNTDSDDDNGDEEANHELFEVRANWYSKFPRFTGRRRSFDLRIRKNVEYWQGLILCNICGNDASDGYHCRICADDHCDICDSCKFGEEKYWCYSPDHSLKRNSSGTKQQNRPPWILSHLKVGVNLAVAQLQDDLAGGGWSCNVCAAELTRGYLCQLCHDPHIYIYIICLECITDGCWCRDKTHLLQEYDNDAISYPWRSHEEMKSRRRKSFDGPYRYPCQKPVRNRRYSFPDTDEVQYNEPWSFERWAGHQLPYAVTSRAASESQGESSSTNPEEDQATAIIRRNRYCSEWEKWWPGGNFSNPCYESDGSEGSGLSSDEDSDKSSDEDSVKSSEEDSEEDSLLKKIDDSWLEGTDEHSEEWSDEQADDNSQRSLIPRALLKNVRHGAQSGSRSV